MREDGVQGDSTAKERAFLKKQWKESVQHGDHGCRAGAAIGRGYLGEWKPILSILSNEEPWLHDAAINVIRYWVNEANSLKEAVKYVNDRLDAEQKLNETVKATLKQAGIEAQRKLMILETEEI